MAKQCEGEWESTLIKDGTTTKKPDGVIRVIELQGKLQGKHNNTDAELVNVKCRGAVCTPASPCHIEFDRDETENSVVFRYHYVSDFISQRRNHITINGRYSKRIKGARRKNVAGQEDGTWIGEKPIT
jgi:hypothetical protein